MIFPSCCHCDQTQWDRPESPRWPPPLSLPFQPLLFTQASPSRAPHWDPVTPPLKPSWSSLAEGWNQRLTLQPLPIYPTTFPYPALAPPNLQFPRPTICNLISLPKILLPLSSEKLLLIPQSPIQTFYILYSKWTFVGPSCPTFILPRGT